MALELFEGTLPYASELFGVFQPLLGWKSRTRQKRAQREVLHTLKHVIEGARGDRRVRSVIASTASASAIDPVAIAEAAPRLPAWLQSAALQAVQEKAVQFAAEHHRPPTADEWRQVVPDLSSNVRKLASKVKAAARSLEALDEAPGADPARLAVSSELVHEATVAGLLTHIATTSPEAMAALASGRLSQWQKLLPMLNLMQQFDPLTQLIYLSPIGMIHLYREYFFELDTFLGPPVGHVWVSPGGSMEVYEVHTTRVAQERSLESTTETVSRSEQQASTQDELSTAISHDNSSNMSVGVTASASVSYPVFSASVSANFNYNSAQKVSQQDTHKQTRTQSEKVSSEIRKSFKTVFKTSLEKTDMNSRRYVLSNSTDKLINYELRRKMRKVAVQVQHIGTQLAWHVFVDEPGRDLGVGQLVHAAAPDDLSSAQPPEAVQPMLPKEADFQLNFPFQGIGDNDDRGANYINGMEGGEDQDERINTTLAVKAPLPAAGYVLSDVKMINFVSPDPSAETSASPSFQITGVDSFQIQLDQIAFDEQPYLLFNLKLLWSPPDAAMAQQQFEEAYAKYEAQQRKAAHDAYVNEVRSRIEAAGSVKKRDADDLREEERTVVYRQLVKQLMEPGENQTPHVASELVRAIFDVDKMLYFVAPEWWMPRKTYTQSFAAARPVGSQAIRKLGKLPQLGALAGSFAGSVAKPVTAAGAAASGDSAQYVHAQDETSWGGASEAGRDNYLVTENSEPAPVGASLGWLLQLDGDARRNAFLNSPWVKAVIPIRPGRERAALDWLMKAHVEGTDGLDAQIDSSETELPGPGPKTIRDAILALAAKIADGQNMDNTLASEKVFEKGFDPLEGGFEVRPFDVFDQWIEVLPTDQVVAVDYEPKLP